MSKNYFSMKTGHKAADKYFKNVPLWFDSDMLKHCALSFIIGFIVGMFVSFFI